MTFLDLFLYIYGVIQLRNMNPVPCRTMIVLYRCTPSVYVYLPKTQLCPFIYSGNQARASLFFNSKRKKKSESYIFYKLSAVKEGAKNQNHKYCT